ncbi:hypothetical protein ACHAPJ_002788 [Fusarium lateritium]
MELSSDENGYESLDDTQLENGHAERNTASVHPESAPRYTVPSRVLGAVEIPAVVENVDRAVKAFGRVPNLQHASHGRRKKLDSVLSNPREPIL